MTKSQKLNSGSTSTAGRARPSREEIVASPARSWLVKSRPFRPAAVCV